MANAFVFPGQGSQFVGMMSDLMDHPIVKETYQQASDALSYDLSQLTLNGPEEKLNQTHITQPAMLTAGVAIYRSLIDAGVSRPKFMAGHSLGEYSALVASDSISLTDGVKLVQKRGQLMQSAVAPGEGAMAAILGLEDQKVVDLCTEVSEGVVEAVNFNSPGQVVIAGQKKSVDEAMELAQQVGAKRVVPLAVSVPSHCALMEPAAQALSEQLASTNVKVPEVAVVHNASVSVYDNVEDIKKALKLQLYRPVQWVKTIEYLKANGVDLLCELGPGKVLLGLNRRIDKRMSMMAVLDSASLISAIETLKN